jgi:hypothetical protein
VIAIYILTSALVLLGAFIAYETYVARKAASEKHREIGWVLGQLDRALAQLESPDEETVVAGLQAITVLNDDAIRNRALRPVTHLTQSPNPRIASEAQFTLKRLSAAVTNEASRTTKHKTVESVRYS